MEITIEIDDTVWEQVKLANMKYGANIRWEPVMDQTYTFESNGELRSVTLNTVSLKEFLEWKDRTEGVEDLETITSDNNCSYLDDEKGVWKVCI